MVILNFEWLNDSSKSSMYHSTIFVTIIKNVHIHVNARWIHPSDANASDQTQGL